MNKNTNNERKITLNRNTLQRLDGARIKSRVERAEKQFTGIISFCKVSCLPVICA